MSKTLPLSWNWIDILLLYFVASLFSPLREFNLRFSAFIRHRTKKLKWFKWPPKVIIPLPLLGSISPTCFYEQLLRSKIPKAHKDTDDLTVFLHFWDLRAQKLHVNMLVKSTLALLSLSQFFLKHTLKETHTQEDISHTHTYFSILWLPRNCKVDDLFQQKNKCEIEAKPDL